MNRKAFTIIELLVTISIIAFIGGAAFLSWGPMKRMVNESNDANALQGSIRFARSSSMRPWTDIAPHTFDGAAAVIEDDWFRVYMSDNHSDLFRSYIEAPDDLERFGFKHQAFERSEDMLVFGLHRDGSSPDAQLIEPPFAVWFDPNGHLKIGTITIEDEFDPSGDVIPSVIGVVLIRAYGADLSRMPVAFDVLEDNPTAEPIMIGRYAGELFKPRKSN